MNPNEVEAVVDKYMNQLEGELGDDFVPIMLILVCRMGVKYNLDINWLVTTIMMGYHNELPPSISMEDVVRFDS